MSKEVGTLREAIARTQWGDDLMDNSYSKVRWYLLFDIPWLERYLFKTHVSVRLIKTSTSTGQCMPGSSGLLAFPNRAHDLYSRIMQNIDQNILNFRTYCWPARHYSCPLDYPAIMISLTAVLHSLRPPHEKCLIIPSWFPNTEKISTQN